MGRDCSDVCSSDLDLPGRRSVGPTANEVLRSADDAIEDWQDAAHEMRRPVTGAENSRRRGFAPDVPEPIRKQAENHARRKGGDQPGTVDHGIVHALFSEGAKAAAIRLQV